MMACFFRYKAGIFIFINKGDWFKRRGVCVKIDLLAGKIAINR
jgi:hypothetical protein